jgi:hypothetical protein
MMMTLKSSPLHSDGCEIAEVAILLLLYPIWGIPVQFQLQVSYCKAQEVLDVIWLVM